MLRNVSNKTVTQWLIHWENLATEEASWEDSSFIRNQFPTFSVLRTRQFQNGTSYKMSHLAEVEKQTNQKEAAKIKIPQVLSCDT